MRKQRVQLTEVQWVEAIRAYEAIESLTCVDMAERLGVAHNTVWRNFNRRGVVIRDLRPRWPESRRVRLQQLRAKGLSFGAIAERMNVTRSAVAGKLDRLAA